MKNTCKNSHFFFVSFVVAVLLGPWPADAQDKTAEIDKIFNWATAATPGCAVAVSQNGKMIANRAYGLADLEREVPISPNTIFDIGSTQKQFVAAAVLLLVEDGKLSLTEDIRKYLPQLPDYGHKITLDHLMTHTSGIRDWTALLPMAGGNTEVLPLILRQRGLNFAPGDEWSYSNSSFVLLKEIVARVSGMSFGEFGQKRLFEPLGMKSTSYHADMRGVIKNRALAYEKENGSWKLAMLLDNDRGGGGLLSTTGDLIIWNDALTNKRLGAFVTEKLQEQAKLNNGRQVKYARGLIIDSYRGVKEVSHSGGAAGYHSWLGRHPAQGLSTVVLCNSDSMAAAALAHRVIDLFVPATGTQGAENNLPPIATGGVDVAGLDLNSKAGLYFGEAGGEPLRLVVDRGRLRVASGPALVALSKDRFKRWGASLEFMSQDEFEVNFLSPDEFELKSMEDKTTRYRRAKPYAPTAADLKVFAGRYESAEIGTVLLVEPKGDGLLVRLEHTPSRSLEVRPVERDTFQISRVTMCFIRDNAGKVLSLDYSNPLIRKVKFTRLGDCQR